MDETKTIKVYVKTDKSGNIIAVSSDIFLDDLTGWVYLDEGLGDKYAHAQGMYFAKPILTEEGIWRYKLKETDAAEKTQQEIQKEKQALASKPVMPSQTERIEALEMALIGLMEQ